MMRTLLTRRAGQAGTKKLLREYGRDLICVRYRYDDGRKQRLKTVEIVIERVAWNRREADSTGESSPARFRIGEGEALLRRAVLLAGGRWDEESDTWTLPRKTAGSLGLMSRIRRR